METVKQILKTILAVPYVKIGLISVVVVVVLVVFFQWQCGSSKLEKKLEQAQDQVTEQKPVEKAAEEKSVEADKKAHDDVKKAREAKNVNTRGTTYDEANSNRCKAYPDDSECKK